MRVRWLAVVLAALGGGATALLVDHRRRRRHELRAELADLERLSEEVVEVPLEEDLLEVTIERVRDSGDLYGAHTVPAADREHPDDDRAQESGETWVEALTENATEGGPEPERPVDFIDEGDIEHPNTDTHDRPVADRGSAGNRGL